MKLRRIQRLRLVGSSLILVCLLPLPSSGADAPGESNVNDLVTLLDLVLDADESTARKCLGTLTSSLQNGGVSPERIAGLREQLGARLGGIVRDGEHPLRFDAALIATAWSDADSLTIVRSRFADAAAAADQRLAAMQALIAVRDPSILAEVDRLLAQPDAGADEFRGQVLAALGRLDQPEIATLVLQHYPALPPVLRTRAIELLTQRPQWSRPLLAAVAAKSVERDALNLNQLRRIATFNDEGIRKALRDQYGEIREGRDPQREQVFYKQRDFLNGTPGDPLNGETVFKKVCAQCHKLYGEGAEVGPDITRNGRNNWDQLLWNVFDPSQVIGPGYQARILITTDGRTLTGLPVEESDQRVVLKVQGGKQETIARSDIEIYKVSELSMMPEQLEKQVTPQELADLLSFLAHDRHPREPEAKLLPGAPAPRR